ncbi:MAG TPA: STAS domain-containing protein [Candidatus Acidoferrales bacterium]|nr:STAS domain-containing protein [Candidatus Acidoferrales bacterium]
MGQARLKMEGDLVHALRSALDNLEKVDGELVLDFTTVRRIEPSALNAMEEIAARAGERHVRVALEAVDVSIYRVLKLTKLASRFT